MTNLKRFLMVLCLGSLLFWPLFSEVVLTDEEAQQVLQALDDCEKTSGLVQTQLKESQEDLAKVTTSLESVQIQYKESQRDLMEISENLNLLESEFLQQEKLWKEQLKEAKKDKVKSILIWSLSALGVGLVGGIILGVSVN